MDMIGKIRRLRSRGKKSEREIARMTGLSRNTVAKWLTGPLADAPKYRRGPQPSKLTAFAEALETSLKADAHRPKHERRTARALYAEAKAAGYDGGYTRVTDFIRAWRQGEGQSVSVNAFVPLSFGLGEAFQFDWSEEGLTVGGIYYRMQVSHMKLCASRAFWLVAYPSQGHEMLFDAHTRSFAALGGVPRRGIYDNMKTAVDKVKKGKGRTVNARFAVMCAHYLFDPDFCNVASGWEKGVVEKNVQDSRRRIWIDAAKQRFGSFVELNAWLGDRCRALWEEVRPPELDRFSVAVMLEHERPHLMPMPAPFDGYVERPARVSSTCLVAVELALEAGPPGKVSVEHVINVLGRLNAAPVPPSAATTLQVAVPPGGQHRALRQQVLDQPACAVQSRAGPLLGQVGPGAGHAVQAQLLEFDDHITHGGPPRWGRCRRL